MPKWAAITCALAMAGFGIAAAEEVKLETDDQKTVYAMGVLTAQNLAVYRFTPEERRIFIAGLEDALNKIEPKVKAAEYMAKIQALANERTRAAAEEELKEAQKFLEIAAQEKGVTKTESGLLYKEIKAGTGGSPKATDRVKVHYHGTLRDGTVFDSSLERGYPATFPLNGVIKCWQEGVQKMKVGGKSKLICPASIAYGERGSPPKIPGNAALTFEVELLEIVPPPTPRATSTPGAGPPTGGK